MAKKKKHHKSYKEETTSLGYFILMQVFAFFGGCRSFFTNLFAKTKSKENEKEYTAGGGEPRLECHRHCPTDQRNWRDLQEERRAVSDRFIPDRRKNPGRSARTEY